jgi:tetratricopeptide (TPR) repeat protein
VAGLATWVAASTAAVQVPVPDDELARHLTTIRSQLENLTIDIARREELALEMAATLDRAAQVSPDSNVRRRRWSEAIDLLDWFLKENSDPPRERQLRFQAAVLRWAQGRSWVETGLASTRDPKPREAAVAALDNAIERFRAVTGGGNNPTLTDNLRFRLAETLADRADLEPVGSADRRTRESEALGLLDQAPVETGLGGFWHLLKADILRRLGKPAEAEREIADAVNSKPAPPPREVVEVSVPLLIERKRYDDAIKSLDASPLDKAVKALWMVRVRLAQQASLPAGAERFKVESDLFTWIKELRAQSSPEQRQALLDLAKTVREPDPNQPPEVWESLADAYGLADEPARAGAAMMRAAGRAAAVGNPAQAAADRLRAGGFLFQAGDYRAADQVLSQAVADPAAGPLRAKAAMLRCLARGRALAAGLPGASSALYATALEEQLRDFPDDPSTNEARWLSGELAVAGGKRERAETLWSAIATSSPRWLDSRLAVAALDRDELDRQQINPDRRKLLEMFERADRFLERAINQARSEEARAELLLARARLNLTPVVGTPETARELCERVSRLAGVPALQYRARLYRLVALVEIGRYVEAEREAQNHATWRNPAELAALFDAVRLLDHCAGTAETDLRQRRFGLVLRLIVEPIVTSTDEKLDADHQSELAMRLTRALLYTGADREARRSVAAWRGGPQTTDEPLLRDLGDTYNRLEAYSLAIDVQRLRLKNNPPGSLAWLDARYALALAYFRAGRLKEAAHLIDSTAILHPELGGHALHDKFIHLRQRLGQKP